MKRHAGRLRDRADRARSGDVVLSAVRGGSPLLPRPDAPARLFCYAGSSVFLSTPSDLVRFALAINSGKLLQPPRYSSPDITATALREETGTV